MESLPDEQLLKLAALARLQLDPAADKRDKLRQDCSSILEMMQKLSEVDVSAVSPLSHMPSADLAIGDSGIDDSSTGNSGTGNSAKVEGAAQADLKDGLREDVRGECLPINETLRNAPDISGRFLRVPLIIT
jgi:Asp-tRNA(Asn)/Glu-tRNA(Gln) amidotransferase C subunit